MTEETRRDVLAENQDLTDESIAVCDALGIDRTQDYDLVAVAKRVRQERDEYLRVAEDALRMMFGAPTAARVDGWRLVGNELTMHVSGHTVSCGFSVDRWCAMVVWREGEEGETVRCILKTRFTAFAAWEEAQRLARHVQEHGEAPKP